MEQQEEDMPEKNSFIKQTAITIKYQPLMEM